MTFLKVQPNGRSSEDSQPSCLRQAAISATVSAGAFVEKSSWMAARLLLTSFPSGESSLSFFPAAVLLTRQPSGTVLLVLQVYPFAVIVRSFALTNLLKKSSWWVGNLANICSLASV